MEQPVIGIVNDDGYNAAGIDALINTTRRLFKNAHIIVFAPKSGQSAVGMSISIKRGDISCEQTTRDGVDEFYVIDGTPCDCVKIGLHLAKAVPDIILSGINNGTNTGQDCNFSGTLAAAREASYNGIPAIAFSNARLHETLELMEHRLS